MLEGFSELNFLKLAHVSLIQDWVNRANWNSLENVSWWPFWLSKIAFLDIFLFSLCFSPSPHPPLESFKPVP